MRQPLAQNSGMGKKLPGIYAFSGQHFFEAGNGLAIEAAAMLRSALF